MSNIDKKAPIRLDQMKLDDERPSEDLSGHEAPEDWTAFILFLSLCFVVFLQFFTRYVLNDSFGWTEEVARYLLIGVVFVGAAMCVRKHRHIQVNFIYRFLPQSIGFLLARIIDLITIIFFAYAAWLMWQLMQIIGDDPMTLIKLPMNVVYYFVLGGLILSCVRSVQVTIDHFKQGYGALERPDAYMDH
jgi:TRAP-type C4-dicarboxylate transport system permease small subunit